MHHHVLKSIRPFATVKASGSNPEMLALVDQIISAQQSEIAQMQAMLTGRSGCPTQRRISR